MLTESSFDDITVFDLCEKACVRRATFYKHFNDKLDFLSHIVMKILDDTTDTVKKNYLLSETPVEYITDYVKQIIAFFREREDMFNSIIKSNAFPLVFDTVTKHTGKLIEKNLQEADMPLNSNAYQKRIVAGFINGGISVILVEWLRTKSFTEEEFLAEIRSMLGKIFS
jgi:AcrR family transcriptional regulator